MAEGQVITLRLRIADPVPGVAYSLQDKKGAPVGQIIAGDGPIAFDVPVRVAPGPRFLGDFVRSEGPSRRFVYIAIGEQAGQTPCQWSRRVKVDIHVLTPELMDKALAGTILAADLRGREKDGSPACATLTPLNGWSVV